MKRLIVVALALVSCAPILGAVQGTASRLTQTGQTLILNNRDSTPLLKAVVAVDGPDSPEKGVPAIKGAVCSMPVDHLSYCRLGDVQPGEGVVLTYTGTLRAANASWRTPAGAARGTAWP